MPTEPLGPDICCPASRIKIDIVRRNPIVVPRSVDAEFPGTDLQRHTRAAQPRGIRPAVPRGTGCRLMASTQQSGRWRPGLSFWLYPTKNKPQPKLATTTSLAWAERCTLWPKQGHTWRSCCPQPHDRGKFRLQTTQNGVIVALDPIQMGDLALTTGQPVQRQWDSRDCQPDPPSQDSFAIVAWVDSDWEGDHATGKSTCGFVRPPNGNAAHRRSTESWLQLQKLRMTGLAGHEGTPVGKKSVVRMTRSGLLPHRM